MKPLLKYIFISLLIIQTLSCNMDNKTPDKPNPEDDLPIFEDVTNQIYSGSINFGETVEIKSFKHSIDNYDTGECHDTVNASYQIQIENCYIYEFTATSKYVSIQTLENESTELEPGYNFSSAAIRLFDKTGENCGVNLKDKNGVTVYSTVVGEKYYIGVVPIETIHNNISYKSDVMKFVIKEYEDKNISVDTAENIIIDKSYVRFSTGENDVDYYKIYLTEGESYFLEIRSSCSTPNFTLTSPPGAEYVFIKSYDWRERRVTATATGEYILEVTNRDLYYTAYPYWITLRHFDTTNLIEPSSNWIDASTITFRSNYYMLNIDPSKDYSISWKDRDNDSINYSGDVAMSLLYGTDTGSVDSIISSESYRKTDSRIIDFTSNTSHAILNFKNWGPFNSGNYVFKIEEVTTHPTCIAVPLGTHTIADINDGVTQFYKFTIDQSKKYILKTMDRDTDNTKYEGNAIISVYTPGKIEYLKRNGRSGFDDNISFSDTTDPNTELILRIHITPGSYSHDWEPIGTIGFELVEDTSNP